MSIGLSERLAKFEQHQRPHGDRYGAAVLMRARPQRAELIDMLEALLSIMGPGGGPNGMIEAGRKLLERIDK